MAALGDAFEIAFAAHAEQTDKSGEPYMAHVVRVAAGVEGEAERIVALLHDVVEDTDVPPARIADRFGPEIAAAIDAITHRPGEPRPDYYARVRANPLARAVKLSDIADNSSPARLARLDAVTQARLTEKYDKAREALA